MRILRWALALTPFLLGVVAAISFNGLGIGGNPLIYLRAETGSVAFVLGLILSLLAAGGLWLWQRAENRIAAHEQASVEQRLRFLRRLDHELKNPITAILAGLANVSYAETPRQRAVSMDSVRSQIERLRRLVADLRKLSDLETRSLDVAPIDLTQLLEDVFALAKEQPAAIERQLTLSIPRVAWPLPTVFGDYELLFLACYNLLDNALKFTQPGDTIELRASETNGVVTIDVADTGAGIDPADLPHVWSELYRGQSAKAVTGSGLGLALVRAIIGRHNGSVAVRSRVGEGALFTIHLPISPGRATL